MASNNTSTLNFLNVKPAVVYASCTLNGIIALLAILGNSSVLLAFFRTSKVRKYHTNYFIVSLALADLTVGCVTIPLYSYMIATNFADYGPKGPLYNVYLVFDVFSGVASIQHLMFISVERYFAIVWPVVHHLWTIKTYYTLLALVWFISTFASCFALEGSKWGQRYNILNFVFLYCIPLIVIAFCYLSILRKTQERFHSPSRKSMRRELKVSSTVFILVLLFIITWSPFFVCTIAMWLTTVTVRSIIFTKCFHFMNSFCNPIVYAARIPDFRMAFSEVLPKSLLQFLCCRSKTHLDSPASSRTRTSSAMSVGTYTQKCSPKCSKESRRHLTSNETKPGSIRKKAPQESIRSTSTSMSPEHCAPAMKSSTPLAFGGLQHTYV